MFKNTLFILFLFAAFELPSDAEHQNVFAPESFGVVAFAEGESDFDFEKCLSPFFLSDQLTIQRFHRLKSKFDPQPTNQLSGYRIRAPPTSSS